VDREPNVVLFKKQEARSKKQVKKKKKKKKRPKGELECAHISRMDMQEVIFNKK
jgi:hypothetical protein